MPRTLPWLAAGAGKIKREAKSPVAEIKRISSPRPRVKNEIKTPARRESKGDFFRSSPSPPSSPVDRCPSEEFLIEGLDHDDIYMMVEDEFYAVAQTFTRHLHYAEFVRRKKEAKDRNAAAIADIARPTDGVTPVSEEMKKRRKIEELEKRQRRGLDGVLDKKEKVGEEDELEEEAEESSWAGTHLQDLILSPRRARSLVGMKGMRSSTRAAAGYTQAQSMKSTSGVREDIGRLGNDDNRTRMEEESKESTSALLDETTDDDDDLDAGAHRYSPTLARSSRVPSSSRTRRSSTVRPYGDNSLDAMMRQPTTTATGKDISSAYSTHSRRDTKEAPTVESKATSLNTTQTKRRLVFDDFDELPELPKPTVQFEKRPNLCVNSKQKKSQNKNTGSKKSRLNEVPTFLI